MLAYTQTAYAARESALGETLTITYYIFWRAVFYILLRSEGARLYVQLFNRIIVKKQVLSNLGPAFFNSLSYYSKSFRFGFLDGSLERKPKVKSEIKKITTV